jgi:quercetin dioxygenase-like cupin family protein
MTNTFSTVNPARPKISILQKSNHFKIILLELEKGSKLKEHKAPGRAKIFVVSGTIEYRSLHEIVSLSHSDTYDIPLEEIHEVVALEPSKFLLIIG